MGNPHGTHVKQVDKTRMGPIWVEMWARSGENAGNMLDPYGQPTWDPYETGGQTTYGAHMGENVGQIWGKCGQYLGPIWATRMGPM